LSNISQGDSKLLNELIKDCITYKLSESEAVEYIRHRYGKSIATITYKHRKAQILSDESTNIWLNNFTRIGFVKNHQADIETIEKIRDDSIHQLQIEIAKDPRDEYKILKLKQDIRDDTQLLSELNLGTPIISAIKAKLESKANDSNSNTQTVQICK
jgi:hypothetical protein